MSLSGCVDIQTNNEHQNSLALRSNFSDYLLLEFSGSEIEKIQEKIETNSRKIKELDGKLIKLHGKSKKLMGNGYKFMEKSTENG